MQIQSGFFEAQTDTGSMQVYYAAPASETHLPAIIVLQEAYGVNDHIKDVCQRFAQEGYYVVAPELFHRSGTHLEIPYPEKQRTSPQLSRLSDEDIADDIKATIRLLSHLPQVDHTRIATVGFCMGGYASILAATRFKISTAISFYGAGLMKERSGIGFGPLRDQFPTIDCPVLLFFGENDSSIPLIEIQEIESAFHDQHIEFEIHIMPHSNHGFFCNQRASFNPEAAQASWKILLSWLEKNMHPFRGESKFFSQHPSGSF